MDEKDDQQATAVEVPAGHEKRGERARVGAAPVEHQAQTVDALLATAAGPPPGPVQIEQLLEEIRAPLAERLQTQAPIAEGGMGTIEIVLDRALQRHLAKKMIHPALQHDSRMVWLFIREAQITGQLDHPNIVPVHDIGIDAQDRLYFTMKRVEGTTLLELFRALPAGRLPAATLYDLLGMLVKACDALAFAHSRNVLHCDLKPDNIMIGDFGEVYLMDWGVARVMSQAEPLMPVEKRAEVLSTAASIMGTPCYMSPEQAYGHRAQMDERSDVFSMGAILFELLFRRPPYHGDSFDETVTMAQSSELAVPPAALAEAVPRELERIVHKAMAQEPEERYGSIKALQADLERFRRGGSEFSTAWFPSGALVVREGAPGDAAYIIESGRCEVFRVVDGEHRRIGVLGPGEVFGETAILTAEPRTASVRTLEDTALYVVTREALERELSELKPWMASLLLTLADRFRTLAQQDDG